LLYTLEQGPHEAEVLRQAYRRGDPPPEVMANAPELQEDLIAFWRAYDELSTCRSFAGMSGVPTSIPWTAINDYALRHNFTGDEFDDLVEIVREVDDAFIAHAMEQIANDNPE
jgi:hypothetical protein